MSKQGHTGMENTDFPECYDNVPGTAGSERGSSTMNEKSRTPVSEQHGPNTRNRFGSLTSEGKHQGKLDPGTGRGF